MDVNHIGFNEIERDIPHPGFEHLEIRANNIAITNSFVEYKVDSINIYIRECHEYIQNIT